ncbi:MAG: EF2563 family selenium-dependent molybdenum hydroxylase system protein [Candidatus Zixiibacteriota bacterium]|nr:MAG: EF2563 family selenium-dependent molybdenum hydroxylase system protein [candidate division Zixibacteria bacterium]
MKRSDRKEQVIVRGAGELASGIIFRLFKKRYSVIALERPEPCCVRRYVCFAEAVYTGEIEIEGVKGRSAADPDEALMLAESGIVSILVDPEVRLLENLKTDILIDGRMLKKDIDVSKDMAGLVIGLGPGFYPGDNCHLAIETNRGPNLGRVLSTEAPREDTAIPAPVNGFTTERVLRSPVDGVISPKYEIGDLIRENDVVAEIGGMAIRSEMDGVLRGICRDGLKVEKGQKIGDIDPRGDKELCYKISDKARAVADGVVRALEQYKVSKVIY